ncbi:MAG TPA: hypothetical protein VJ505_15465 [Holophagaceae bacterium]|nr:hypothetical protein [Holophagaceae bacterium]
MHLRPIAGLACMLVASQPLMLQAQAPAKAKAKAEAETSPLAALGGLPFRSIGPARTSGRVVDIVVDPTRPATWYVAAGSGGVWKTENAGTSWTPILEREGSYAIGCITLDPKDPLTIWVGSGENNSHRSVGFGDGVYKSVDGGRTWENVGLKTSEHIGKILVDPKDSRVVYVAAQGPLWSAGGERGLYKTTDGGKTWKAVLTVSEHTGVSDVVMDPRNSEVLYAAAYQRRRHVWTLIDGGPESAIHKSTDGGLTWKKLAGGLPKEEMGRIGLAISPQDPDVVYATIEAANKEGGFFRSTDGGANWEKRSPWVSGAAMYYQELFADPTRADRVYAMDTFMQVSDDAGKTWRRVGEKDKHVDNHALWIDPAEGRHLLAGCDGGVYESHDQGATWSFKANLPIAQFYRVAVDNALPFYNVYGGTQDNFSLGGPSRTTKAHGATNEDWFATQSGDGFYSQVDPEDPDTVYSESQYGGLARFDRRTGEAMDIQPVAAPGEPPLRWNWDSPLLLSPHQAKRVYFAANKLFRSDDRGNTWTPVSPDLTRQLDRNSLKVMGRAWSVDAVARHASTSNYGNIVALAESPKAEGLLFVGTDDGLLQVSEDGGKAWRKLDTFPGVPDRTYTSSLSASPHRAEVVYAAFNNHKNGDFKPYLLRSADRGRTWVSIAGNLPARGPVHVIREDPAREGLLYAGTEFGLFFSLDGGKAWTPFKELPTIPVRDLAIQAREGDLVVATFGRGFYILDDLTPLREAKAEALSAEAHLFATRPAPLYVEARPFGYPGKAFMGGDLYTAPNPAFGAVFTYHLKSELKSLRKQRQAQEREVIKAGGEPKTPSWADLTAEAREAAPQAVLTISDAQGKVLRNLAAPVKAGLHRVAWDLRRSAPDPISLKPKEEGDPWEDGLNGALVPPGTYRAQLGLREDGILRPVAAPITFEVKVLPGRSTEGLQAITDFQASASELLRQGHQVAASLQEALDRLAHVRKALQETPGIAPELIGRGKALNLRLRDLQVQLRGDGVKGAYQEPPYPGLLDRVERVASGVWATTQVPTSTQRQNLAWAEAGFAALKPQIREAMERDLKALEAALDQARAVHTPGRLP